MKPVALAAVVTLWAGLGLAQPSKPIYNGHGYAYFGIGGRTQVGTSFLSFGGGGEGFLYKGLAAGAELAYMAPRCCMNEGIGLLGISGAHHFVNRRAPGRVVPFVTAGFTGGFRSGWGNLWNWGGGATVWMNDHLGLRLEVRDLRQRRCWFNTSLRVGLSFR